MSCNRFPHVLAAAAILATLAGCASYPTPAPGGATVRAESPLVSVSRLSGSSAGRAPQAQGVATVGNHMTPARLVINARAGAEGVRVSPVLQSQHVTWRF